MTDITLTSAEKVVRFAYSMRDDGFYCRPRDGELRDFGGRLISSSNDGASLVSCSPTDVWEFPDGSRVEIGYSNAEVIAQDEEGCTVTAVRQDGEQ